MTSLAPLLKRTFGVATLGALTALFLPLILSAPTASPASAPPQVDLSRARGAQTEASIAIDPRNPKILLAGSQNGTACALRVYSSGDGGRSWRSTLLSTPGGQLTRRDPRWRGHLCAGNQWVGVDLTGRQYIAFVAGDVARARRGYTLFVATREGGGRTWHTPVQVDSSSAGHDDKPMLLADTSPATAHRGRVYVAWSRYTNAGMRTVVVAHSDDGGRTWSRPQNVGSGWGVHLALARSGTLYACWWGSDGMLEVSSSVDGGDRFTRPRPFLSLLRYTGFGSGRIPAMRQEVVRPNPSLDADRSNAYPGRVYAVASVPNPRGRVILVSVFNSKLRKLAVRRLGVAPGRRVRDAFNPAVDVDQSNGTVWLCFYLSGTGRSRILATYSCTKSRNGGMRWTTIRPVASVPSNEAQAGGFRTPSGIDNEYASYEGLAVSHGVAYPVWTDTRRLRHLREEIYGARTR